MIRSWPCVWHDVLIVKGYRFLFLLPVLWSHWKLLKVKISAQCQQLCQFKGWSSSLTFESACLWTGWPCGPLWQLTVDGTLDHTGDVHLPLLLQIQLQHVWNKEVNSWQIIKPTVVSQPSQSITAWQQLDRSALQFPEAFVLAGDTLCWAASGQQGCTIKAAVKAILTQCVFVNEPDDEVGQGLNSCGDGSATARRLQLQPAPTHYEWIKGSARSNDINLCMGILLKYGAAKRPKVL